MGEAPYAAFVASRSAECPTRAPLRMPSCAELSSLSMNMTASAVRLVIPSLVNMLLRCNFTVPSVMQSWRAIILFELPSHSDSITCRSRGVKFCSDFKDYLLLKLNARSKLEPALPVKLPLRLKNDVVPFPLLTADPVK